MHWLPYVGWWEEGGKFKHAPLCTYIFTLPNALVLRLLARAYFEQLDLRGCHIKRPLEDTKGGWLVAASPVTRPDLTCEKRRRWWYLWDNKLWRLTSCAAAHCLFTLLPSPHPLYFAHGNTHGQIQMILSWVGIHGCSRFYKFDFKTCTNLQNLLQISTDLQQIRRFTTESQIYDDHESRPWL